MINLQKEFKKIIGEYNDNIIIRHLTDIKCPCVSIRGKAAGPDPSCRNCDGAGFVFNEFLIKCKTYYTPRTVAHAQDAMFGQTYKNLLTVYVEAIDLFDQICIDDFIYQIKQNIDGSIQEPIVKTRKWTINDVYDMRMDDSKLEFIKIFAKPVIV